MLLLFLHGVVIFIALMLVQPFLVIVLALVLLFFLQWCCFSFPSINLVFPPFALCRWKLGASS
jgi:hypothetical protein